MQGRIVLNRTNLLRNYKTVRYWVAQSTYVGKTGHVVYCPPAVDFDTMSIFKMQEIAGLVCSFSEPRDQVGLMRTCRVVCNAALPFVWHTVNDARNLFRLLPPVIVKSEEGAVVR
jgi:hypothetical protein